MLQIVTAIEEHNLLTTTTTPTVLPSITDVLICSVGHRQMYSEQLMIARELWDTGVNAEISDGVPNLEENKEYCRLHRIGHLVVKKDSGISIHKVVRSTQCTQG